MLFEAISLASTVTAVDLGKAREFALKEAGAEAKDWALLGFGSPFDLVL